jgi:lipopolysaccharide/colanic/teichoic acid biosynthesis glycosyltransferase
MLGYYWSQLPAAFGWLGGSPSDFLLSPDEMHEYIDHERLRADRTGATFSVVNFTVVRGGGRKAAIGELSRILKLRLRVSDRAGMLHDGRVSLVLPDTAAEGGHKLANEVRSMWFANTPAPAFEVYAYPSEQTTTDFHDWMHQGGQSAAKAGKAVQGVEVLVAKRMPIWKRCLDIIGACVGLILLSPLFLVVATAIKLTSPGPVIFGQRRSGRRGKPFWLYKFRSMVVDAEKKKKELMEQNEQDGPAFKIENDPRVTKVGRFLRATSIDELPQLWNVLKGEMSLVGPRPLPCHESDECLGWQRRRLDVTPGLTCFWQVKDGRTKIPFVDWVRMDLQYIKSRSPKVDLGLIAETVRFIFRRRGC